MKILKFVLLCMLFTSTASAANITIFYSPTCPHCHHALHFISNDLIYEYDDLVVTKVDVTTQENRQTFIDALKKCEYSNGGVPVLVIGEKCFQGYGESLDNEIRSAIEVDFTDDQKQSAIANREELKKNRPTFTSKKASRQEAIVDNTVKKKVNDSGNGIKLLLGCLILFIFGIWFIVKKSK